MPGFLNHKQQTNNQTNNQSINHEQGTRGRDIQARSNRSNTRKKPVSKKARRDEGKIKQTEGHHNAEARMESKEEEETSIVTSRIVTVNTEHKGTKKTRAEGTSQKTGRERMEQGVRKESDP